MLTIDAEALRPLIKLIVAEALAELSASALGAGDQIAISEADAAKLLGLNRHQLRDARRRKEITCSRIGRRVVYDRGELRAYLARAKES